MIKTLVKMESCLIMPKMWTTSAKTHLLLLAQIIIALFC